MVDSTTENIDVLVDDLDESNYSNVLVDDLPETQVINENNHGGKPHTEVIKEKMLKLLVLELSKDGIKQYLEMNTRELYDYVHQKTANIFGLDQLSPGMENQSNLHSRDVRQLDKTFSNENESAIIVRRHALLMKIDPIRTIILYDRILILVPKTGDEIVDTLQNRIFDRELINNFDTIFEFRAVEAVLSISVSFLNKEFSSLRPQIYNFLEVLSVSNAHPSTKDQEKLRVLKDEVNSLDLKVKSLSVAIEMVLDDDTDLGLMYLSKQLELNHPSTDEDDSSSSTSSTLEDEEAELLLEGYLQDLKALRRSIEELKQRIDSTEASVQLKLDISRNQLLLTVTIFSLLSVCFGFGTLIGAFFGMNLWNGHENSYRWFCGVSIGIAIFVIIAASSGYCILVKIGVLV